MDTPPPSDPPNSDVPSEPPILLPASDLPPLAEPDAQERVVLSPWAPASRRVDAPLFIGLLGIGAVAYVLLLMAGGLANRFAVDGLEVLPFLGLALLAYSGERSEAGRIVTAVYWLILMAVAVASMTVLTAVANMNVKVLVEIKTEQGKLPNLAALFLPHGLEKSGLTFGLCVVAMLLSAVGFARWARRLAARCIRGFDAASFVHAVALATVVGLTLILFVPGAVTGEPPLLTIVRNFTGADLGEVGQEIAKQLSDPDVLLDQVFSFVWLLPLGIMAVGWPLHRTLGEALRRVGLVIDKPWYWGVAVILAAILALLMSGLVDPAIGWLWDRLHWPRTDEKAFDQLFQAVANPFGAVVIAVTAGVGEELFARGILQPRLGILLSNLFFTSLHAAQYGWDALLSVFIIGLVLGLIRKKTNTTTSAVVHGTYDFLLVMAQYYQFDPSKLFGW
jgi:membrane protease YdiL (CAAX protease family)